MLNTYNQLRAAIFILIDRSTDKSFEQSVILLTKNLQGEGKREVIQSHSSPGWTSQRASTLQQPSFRALTSRWSTSKSNELVSSQGEVHCSSCTGSGDCSGVSRHSSQSGGSRGNCWSWKKESWRDSSRRYPARQSRKNRETIHPEFAGYRWTCGNIFQVPSSR